MSASAGKAAAASRRRAGLWQLIIVVFLLSFCAYFGCQGEDIICPGGSDESCVTVDEHIQRAEKAQHACSSCHIGSTQPAPKPASPTTTHLPPAK